MYTNFYVGGANAWNATDRNNIHRALAAAMTDRNLNNVLLQYFRGRAQITSTFRPSHVLDGSPPDVFSQDDVEALLASLNGAGGLAGFDFGSTVFNFMLPRGTVLTIDDGDNEEAPERKKPRRSGLPTEADEAASSKEGLGGFHGSIHAGQKIIYYAVG